MMAQRRDSAPDYPRSIIPDPPLGKAFEKDSKDLGFIPAIKIYYPNLDDSFLSHLNAGQIANLISNSLEFDVGKERLIPMVKWYVKKMESVNDISFMGLIYQLRMIAPSFEYIAHSEKIPLSPNNNMTVAEIILMFIEKKICKNDVQKWKDVYTELMSHKMSSIYKIDNLILKKISTLV